jgi:hypothetical protein
MPQLQGPNGGPVRLFERRCTLDIGQGSAIRISGLRVAFKITKTDKPEPNKGEIQIWNLAAQHRKDVEVHGVRCVLSAGYPGNEAQIYSGDVHFAQSEKQGDDYITKIELGDGLVKFRRARVGQFFPPGTTLVDVAKHLGAQLAGDLGNLVARVGSVGAPTFSGGLTLDGSAQQALTNLLADHNLTWSLQDGRIEVLERGEFLPGQGPLISENTGMVGPPSFGHAKKLGGVRYLMVKTLLQPGMRPGQGFQLQSKSINGTFRCHQVVHDGDVMGPNWYSEIEAL